MKKLATLVMGIFAVVGIASIAPKLIEVKAAQNDTEWIYEYVIQGDCFDTEEWFPHSETVKMFEVISPNGKTDNYLLSNYDTLTRYMSRLSGSYHNTNLSHEEIVYDIPSMCVEWANETVTQTVALDWSA